MSSDGIMMFDLGGLAYEEGDKAAERDWYEQAAKLGNPKAMAHLDLLAEKAGDLDAARPSLPSSPETAPAVGLLSLRA